ncbi:hypothetical protein QV13_24155 [Mesorhizobium hungaricum]|uniref:Uncharacterized protein n=1 Tax=Mesorhizobium hungaricum TaxID=1566387 RepID=A0A1C2DD53_9HYPH|nr:hypothetical protein QV13_24155 [Mesorhizobium hungaricum]
MRRAGVVAARAVPSLFRDSIGLVGAGAFVFGVWQIHVPSAWIAGGMMLMVVAFRLAASSAGDR